MGCWNSLVFWLFWTILDHFFLATTCNNFIRRYFIAQAPFEFVRFACAIHGFFCLTIGEQKTHPDRSMLENLEPLFLPRQIQHIPKLTICLKPAITMQKFPKEMWQSCNPTTMDEAPKHLLTSLWSSGAF